MNLPSGGGNILPSLIQATEGEGTSIFQATEGEGANAVHCIY